MAKSKRSGGLFVTIAIILLAAAGAWYFFGRSREQPPEYQTAVIGRGTVTQSVTATGGLQAVISVDVSSQISGLINKVAVDFNTPVKTGQVLAEIDPATYQSRLRQSEADLSSTKASYTLTRLNTERTRELRAKNLVTQQELDQAEAQLAQADAQLQQRQALVESARVDLERCTIKSPIDGIVIDRQAEVGKTVAASLNAPTLFTIANDLSKMQINAAVAEADIGNVEPDQPVTFTVDAYPDRQFRGRVIQIRNSPTTEQNVVTYQTIIEVRNDDLKLKPGMTANVSIVVASRPNVLRLPNAALRVRIPEEALAPAPATASGAPAAKPLTEEERRHQLQQLMRDAGFTPGSGPPSPEVRARMQELAKERGLDLSTLRGSRGNRDNANTAGPVTRTVYRLVGADSRNRRPQAVTVKLGINDGFYTEIIDGLNEGDLIITSAFFPSSTGGNAPSSNPFSGGRRRF